jgi:acetylornithine aminotransferase
MNDEKLVDNARSVGEFLMKELAWVSEEMTVRGLGLMIGIEFPYPVKEIRARLLSEFHIFTGFSGTNIIRLLPPLTLSIQDASRFINSFRAIVQKA